jgi:LCP family protein required for cell wall assembly
LYDDNVKNILMKHDMHQKKSSKFKWIWILSGTGIAFFLINFFLLFVLIIHLNIFDLFIHFSPRSSVSGLNILAFGIDDTAYSKRSDAIIVLHLDKDSNHIGALSIPRDTRVSIPGVGRTRINHAFSHGGVDLLKDSISQFLGVPINYYVKVDLSGVMKLVDVLGGVEIKIDKSLNYIDYAGDLYIDIPKGNHVLKGKKVMEYLRFRHDEEGDIGRIRRQQVFLDQLIKKILSFDALLKLPDIITTIKTLISTDMSLPQMLALTRDFKNAVSQHAISKATVPGSSMLVGGAYYWKPNITALDKVVEKTLFGLNDAAVDTQEKTNAFNNEIVAIASVEPKQTNLNTVQKPQLSDINKSNKSITLNIQEASVKSSKFQSLDDFELSELELTDYERKLLKSENLSEIFDNQLDTNTTVSTLTSEQKERTFETLQESPLNESENQSKAQEKIAKTSSHSESKKDAVTNRRSLLPKEVKRIASTGLLADNPKFEGVKCEVLNGIGTAGIAKEAAKIFKVLGMVVPRFANAGHFDYKNTMIVDWRGNVDQSLELANLLDIDPDNIIVYNLKEKPLDFTIVLGKDWISKSNLLDTIYNNYKVPDSI